MAGDFVGHAFGQGVHVVAEFIDSGKDPRVEHVAQNEQVGRLAFVGKTLGDFVHADGKVRALVKEVFHGEIALQLRHAHGGWNGQKHGGKRDHGRRFSLTRTVSDPLEPFRVHDGLDLALFGFALASVQPVVHADPNQRRPKAGQDEGGQHAQSGFYAEGAEGRNIAEQVGGKRRHGRQRRQRDGPADPRDGDAAGFF